MTSRQSVTYRLPRSEIDRAVRAVGRWTEGLRRALEKVIRRYAQLIWERAVDLCPVDTGNLRSTIEQVEEILTGFVGRMLIGTNKTTYALYVEQGTRHMDAQPYLRPAFLHYREAFLQAIQQTTRTHK